MAVTLPAAARQAVADAIAVLMDAGAGAGVVEIRTGAAPDPDSAASGTLLATLTCSDPAFGAATDDGTTATATADTITDDTSADATDTAAHFRAEDSNGACVMQGTVTATGGGGDMELNTTAIVTGGTVSVTAWTITVGQAQT